MAKYLIDTTVFIDYWRGRGEAINFLKKQKMDLLVSYLTIGELVQGVRNKKELKMFEEIVSGFDLDWSSREIGIKAIEILKELKLKQGIGLVDAILAATALTRKLVLVTDNVKHFKFVKELKVKKLSEMVK
ncbi:MAG: type II toxin-antitoxin system VapC family toxin [Patescibacteria group bacterium]|nr:type II toxin-antitoxin system VapC family toxin [Patescibacteria group bacterium]